MAGQISLSDLYTVADGCDIWYSHRHLSRAARKAAALVY